MGITPATLERVAHRGASRECLENTRAAFRVALERGADGLELDVHVTKDGVVVVHHDHEVEGRPISRMSWADVGTVPLKDDSRIPQLKDVLTDVGGRAQVYIELKGAGSESAAVELAKRVGQRFAVHSFDHAMIERALRIAPDVPRGILIDRGTPRAAVHMKEAARRTKPRDVWPHASLVDSKFMSAASALGLRVIVWTVNSLDDARRFAELGVAGICTDDVRILANL